MNKKDLAFVALIMTLHLCAMLALIYSRLSCGVQPHCVSFSSEVLGDVLAFPLGIVSMLMEHLGIDVDEVIKRSFGGEIAIFYLVNSLLAAIIIWFAAVKPLIRVISLGRRSTP